MHISPLNENEPKRSRFLSLSSQVRQLVLEMYQTHEKRKKRKKKIVKLIYSIGLQQWTLYV